MPTGKEREIDIEREKERERERETVDQERYFPMIRAEDVEAESGERVERKGRYVSIGRTKTVKAGAKEASGIRYVTVTLEFQVHRRRPKQRAPTGGVCHSVECARVGQ
jgi:hypothetical protein